MYVFLRMCKCVYVVFMYVCVSVSVVCIDYRFRNDAHYLIPFHTIELSA